MADPKTKAVQLNTEGLFRLLGGSSAERQRFWEIFKGVTTPVELRLLNSQLDQLAASVKAIEAQTKALKATAQSIAKRG
jgi:hypothetical protein